GQGAPNTLCNWMAPACGLLVARGPEHPLQLYGAGVRVTRGQEAPNTLCNWMEPACGLLGARRPRTPSATVWSRRAGYSGPGGPEHPLQLYGAGVRVTRGQEAPNTLCNWMEPACGLLGARRPRTPSATVWSRRAGYSGPGGPEHPLQLYGAGVRVTRGQEAPNTLCNCTEPACGLLGARRPRTPSATGWSRRAGYSGPGGPEHPLQLYGAGVRVTRGQEAPNTLCNCMEPACGLLGARRPRTPSATERSRRAGYSGPGGPEHPLQLYGAGVRVTRGQEAPNTLCSCTEPACGLLGARRPRTPP